MYIHPDDETTDFRSYCSLRNAMEESNRENGHSYRCAFGAGGNCTCGVIDYCPNDFEPADSEAVHTPAKPIDAKCNCTEINGCEVCIPF